jgi:hypothetical protein
MKDFSFCTHSIVLYDESVRIDPALGDSPIRNEIVSLLLTEKVGINVSDTSKNSKCLSDLVFLDGSQKPTNGSVAIN